MGLFRRQNIVTRADKISDFTVNTAEYGSAVPEVLGTTRIGGNVIYYDDFTAHEHSETHKSGKGGGSKQTNIWYTYSVAVILSLCEGPIHSIGKVWRDKEVYNYPDSNIELTLFSGTQNQQPWAYVTGKHPEKALSYPGLAYMAGVIDMGDRATLPQFNFEIRGQLLSTGDGIDVNPADYIRYVLNKVGLSNVPIDGLDHYRSFCSNIAWYARRTSCPYSSDCLFIATPFHHTIWSVCQPVEAIFLAFLPFMEHICLCLSLSFCFND